jgi:hypothetical protein
MTPTNAIPGESSPKGLQVLSFGIDSIWLNVSGELPEDTLVLLDWAKEMAQQSPTRQDLSPLPPFCGTNLMMDPSGVKGYDYVARSADITVELRRSVGLPLPPVVVRLSSECLWRFGGGGWNAIEAAVEWVRLLFPDGCQIQVSKVHQCADVLGWVPVVADLAGIVKRADKLHLFALAGAMVHEDGIEYHLAKGDRLTGLAAGRSTRIRANIYDKTLEIRSSGKVWFRDVWAARLGGEVVGDVWRVEYQYGREFLHKYNIETVDDLRAHQAGLWGYGLGWFSWRERNPADADHSQRWPLLPVWAALLGELPQSEPLPLVKVVRPKLVRSSQAAYGYITSIMALTGEDDEERALERVLHLMRVTKGIDGMREVLRKKKQRYAGRTMSDSGEVNAEWRERLAVRAEASKVSGQGRMPLYRRLKQWGVGPLAV